MAQDQASQFLVQGINAAKAGQKDQARQLFQNALKLDPQNETAWLWMSSVAKDQRERLFCLQNLIQINPRNEMAIKGLRALGVDPATIAPAQANRPAQNTAATPDAATNSGRSVPSARAATAGASNVPALDAAKLNALMPSIDEFLRTYKPLPMQEIAITQKKGRLYGEAAAVRRRAIRMGAVLAVAAVGLLVLVGVLLSLLSGEEQVGQSEAVRPSLTPSFTPTSTPTATPGATNTPSPEPDEPLVVAFNPANDLPRGSIYGGTATPVFPNISPALGLTFQQAVALYGAGQYTEAFGTLEAVRASNSIQCFPDPYYYQIIGLAEQGGRRNFDDAQALIDEAQERPGCQDTDQIMTAACFKEYMQGVETGDTTHFDEAFGWCTAAYEEFGTGRPIALAAWTISNLWMLRDQPDSARAALDQALSYNEGDVNLLLQRARIEILANNDLVEALEYINRALYVDPASEPALRARVEAYLEIAARETDPQRQLLLYGTAVLYTQEYLLFYAGDPDGYLLLARARLGEGNIDLAEEAVNRVIENADNLPENERLTVQQAYAVRARIYEQTARFEQALEDVQILLRDNPNNTAYLEQRTRLAYRLGRYPLALEGVNQLLTLDAEQPDLRLLRYRLTTELCQFETAIECDYQTVLSEITDDFIAALTPEQQSEARMYRGIALYQVTQATAEDALSASQREDQYEDALADLNAAAAVSQTALNVYYQGLVQEALENAAGALGAYNYLAYWSQFYDYPFAEDVQERIEALAEQVESAS